MNFWGIDLTELSCESIIAIDGKCLRRSVDKASNKAAIYMVSAGQLKISWCLVSKKYTYCSSFIQYRLVKKTAPQMDCS